MDLSCIRAPLGRSVGSAAASKKVWIDDIGGILTNATLGRGADAALFCLRIGDEDTDCMETSCA